MTAPALSVIIGAHNAASVIRECLTALARQTSGAPFEVIVADSSTDDTPAIVRAEFPRVTLIHTDEPLGVPQLRGRALGVAKGGVIAILDPFSVAEPDWVEAVVAAHAARSNDVIGGSVNLFRKERQPLDAWAIYFNEYGMFMPPIEARATPIVAGSNVSYKRAVLFDGDRLRHPVFWKTFVNEDAAGAGSPLWLEPSIRVSLNKPVAFGDFLTTRVSHGRCFAGMRTRNASGLERAMRAAASPLLPFVLWARWTRVFWPKGHHRGRYLVTTPLQLILFAAWAWGECLGYLRGPERSCEQLYY
jgi:glycosyltransferase involved in cell wall biosynthesis